LAIVNVVAGFWACMAEMTDNSKSPVKIFLIGSVLSKGPIDNWFWDKRHLGFQI